MMIAMLPEVDLLSRLPKPLRRVLPSVFAFFLSLVVVERLLDLIAIHRPRRFHKATRKLLRHVSRACLWAAYRFDLGRHSEEVMASGIRAIKTGYVSSSLGVRSGWSAMPTGER